MRWFVNKMLFGGKNGQLPYWVASMCRYLTPMRADAEHVEALLREAASRDDYEYMLARAAFYCQLDVPCTLPTEAHTIGEYRYGKPLRAAQRFYPDESLAKTYFFDSNEILRHFPHHLRWIHLFGDVTRAMDVPTVVKTRPIACDRRNSVVLNLDKNRHFTFLHDTIPFREKKDMLICRCSINGQPQRKRLFREFFHMPWCDLGEVADVHDDNLPEWRKPKISLYKHLENKYVACFEGNDVASNLKWVMSSKSAAVMCRPTCESWFMESLLVPGYHYIEVAPDLSDLEEKIAYYNAHVEEAEAIVAHANDYVSQFLNPRREFLIGVMTMMRYFTMTGQSVECRV
ncbi:MAG: lipopolysaccharide biosynthesis protein [Bacteroidaceae bacterium]|mgnify:FL=1|nr:lipopolysaccharide biosynthesis protein [Bacteroidaceae bacterium]